MKPKPIWVIAAGALALAGCVGHPAYREEPHHFSRDPQGRRIACYETDVAREYECVPVYRRYVDAPYPEPWSHVRLGFHYGWPYWHGAYRHHYYHHHHEHAPPRRR